MKLAVFSCKTHKGGACKSKASGSWKLARFAGLNITAGNSLLTTNVKKNIILHY